MAIEDEGMSFDFKFKDVAHTLFDLMKPGVAKFENFSTVEADEVVVLGVAVCFFKDGSTLAELVFDDQAAFGEQFEGVVHGGSADVVVVLFHEVVEAVGIEMFLGEIDFFEYGHAFGCAAEFVFEQVIFENLFYFMDKLVLLVVFHAVVLFFDARDGGDVFEFLQ